MAAARCGIDWSGVLVRTGGNSNQFSFGVVGSEKKTLRIYLCPLIFLFFFFFFLGLSFFFFFFFFFF